MSRIEKQKSVCSSSSQYPVEKVISDLANSDSKTVVINYYSNGYSLKSDRLIQTESSVNRILEEEEEKKVIEIDSGTEASRRIESGTDTPSFDKSDWKSRQISRLKKLYRPMSDEKKEEKVMEPRRIIADNRAIKNPAIRTTSDLERRKMEVELKAAEEIARIRQSLIEKRLALELASIEEGVDFQHKALQQQRASPQHCTAAEMRAIEEMAMRKQSLVETSMAQELETLDYQYRMQQPARLPSPSPAPKQTTTPTPKTNPFNTESSSSVLNTLRGFSVDKKLNLDRKFSAESGQKSPQPQFQYQYDPRYYQVAQVAQVAQDQSRRTSDPRYQRYPMPPGKPAAFPSFCRERISPTTPLSAIHKTFIG